MAGLPVDSESSRPATSANQGLRMPRFQLLYGSSEAVVSKSSLFDMSWEMLSRGVPSGGAMVNP